MIAKVMSAGGGFRGVLDYLTNANKVPDQVSGNMLGEDARSLSREFSESRAMNERVGKPVFHGSLSLHPDDGLTAQQWDRAAREYVARMGYGNSQWVAYRHGDRDHDHIHIVASRIDFDGKRVRDFQERSLAEEIVRDLRQELGLREVPRSRDVRDRRITLGQAEQFVRTGEVSPKVAIRSAIGDASQGQPTMTTFAKRLEKKGVELVPKIQASGRVSGVSFRLDEVQVAGSSLGRPYSWSNLQKVQGVRFDPSRDLDFLKVLADREPAGVRAAAAARELEVIAPQRAALPHDRDPKEIRRKLLRVDPLESPHLHLRDHGIHKIYKDSLGAQEEFRRSVERDGLGVYGILRDRPEAFGKLQGRGIGVLETPARRDARSRAAAASRAGLANGDAADVLRSALPKAKELEKAWLAARYMHRVAIGRQQAAEHLMKAVSKQLGKAVEEGARLAIGLVTPPPVKLVLAVGRVATKVVKRSLARSRGGMER